MDWVYLAAGATGALTFVFVCRQSIGRLLGGPGVRFWFHPAEKPLDALLAAIRNARREILIQVGQFSAPELAQTLIAAKQRKVAVEVILSPWQERDPASVLSFLLDQGLAPLIDHDQNETRGPVVIIDERIVFVGSLPLGVTDGSEYLIALDDQPGVATAFRREFFLRREKGRPPQLRPMTNRTPTPEPMPVPIPVPVPAQTQTPVRRPMPTPTPPQTPATPPISETLARLLPGLRGVHLPSEADQDEMAEQKPAA